MNRPLIVLFVGVPGSGKTTFARQLATEIRAIHVTSDGVRSAMWGDRSAVDAAFSTKSQRQTNNLLVFGALDYVTLQTMNAGHSVVYDCNSNRYNERADKYELAKRYGGVVVTVRIKVPYDVALRRMQQRDESHDVLQFSPEKAKQVLDQFTKSIQEPDNHENVIYIDGEVSFDVQLATFNAAIDKLTN
ncbi:MAG: ATP-binding protein [Candidatus Saccharimonadales bacterium]